MRNIDINSGNLIPKIGDSAFLHAPPTKDGVRFVTKNDEHNKHG